MNMKEHILTALKEQLERWDVLLASLQVEQITHPQFDFGWSIQDVIAHLWAWQQISGARLEAGLRDHEPQYPEWILSLGENWEDHADRVNALTFERNHEKQWSEVHENWRSGFLHLLELGEQISERNILNGDRYSWLRGYSLALILISSYEHHQEHFEKITDSLQKYMK